MRLIGELTPKLSLYGTISKTAEVIGSNVQPLTVRNNGTYEASNGVDGFNPIYVNTPEPKEEQEKIVDIIENGTVEILPDGNRALPKVTIKSNVPDTSDTIEDIIDNSGVLDSTEGTATEKVEQLIDKAEELDVFKNITDANRLFYQAKSFPNKAEINLPNTTNLYQAFAYWNSTTEPVPIVEELTINAPNIAETSLAPNGAIAHMFIFNNGVRRVTLKVSDEIQKMSSTFHMTKALEEVNLSFLTKNITMYNNAFNSSAVKNIIGVLDFSSAINVTQMFNNCSNLKEVTFAPNTLSLSISLAQSSKLTSESLQSIIDGLATVTTAQTLTLAKATVLTDEQKASINAKGWTLVQ